MKRKDHIQQLKKSNPSFSKGAFNTKLTVVLSLILILFNQGAMAVLAQQISELAVIHMVIQVAAVLLILTGKLIFLLCYLAAMLASLGLGVRLYLMSESLFYLVQCVFFLASSLMMLNLLIDKHARTYRNALKNLKKTQEQPAMKAVEEKPDEPEAAVVSDVQSNQEPAEEIPVPVKRTVQMLCPDSVDFSYGSFSRFLVQHYPFVYLHPHFDIHASKVQMCISAEGFDQNGEELYSGEFQVVHQEGEQTLLSLEYEDEMGHLCALICADWLMMQKATLLEDGVNASEKLMRKLTEAFVLAQDSQKQPFKGFQKL